jgi:hypothetical protein
MSTEGAKPDLTETQIDELATTVGMPKEDIEKMFSL